MQFPPSGLSVGMIWKWVVEDTNSFLFIQFYKHSNLIQV